MSSIVFTRLRLALARQVKRKLDAI